MVWKVDSVTRMREMFREASLFNQPIGTWRVDKVTDMRKMFYEATNFSQSVEWCLSRSPAMDSTTTTTYYYQVPAPRAQKGAPGPPSLWSKLNINRTHYVLVAAPPSSPPTYLSSCCSKSGEPTRPPAVGSCTGDLTTHSTQSWA